MNLLFLPRKEDFILVNKRQKLSSTEQIFHYFLVPLPWQTLLAAFIGLLHCTGQGLILYFNIVIQCYTWFSRKNTFVTEDDMDTHKLIFQTNFVKRCMENQFLFSV